MIYAWRAWRVLLTEVRQPLPPMEDDETMAEYWARLGSAWSVENTISTVRRYALCSIVTGEPWRVAGPTTAHCHVSELLGAWGRSHQHIPPPAPNCGCGLWGTTHPGVPMGYVMTSRDVGGWMQSLPMVLGVVGMWGTVVPHERGYRASRARPIALTVVHDGLPYRELAERYDIPVFPTVEALGTEFKIL